jgi:hypothetical protein
MTCEMGRGLAAVGPFLDKQSYFVLLLWCARAQRCKDRHCISVVGMLYSCTRMPYGNGGFASLCCTNATTYRRNQVRAL